MRQLVGGASAEENGHDLSRRSVQSLILVTHPKDDVDKSWMLDGLVGLVGFD